MRVEILHEASEVLKGLSVHVEPADGLSPLLNVGEESAFRPPGSFGQEAEREEQVVVVGKVVQLEVLEACVNSS